VVVHEGGVVTALLDNLDLLEESHDTWEPVELQGSSQSAWIAVKELLQTVASSLNFRTGGLSRPMGCWGKPVLERIIHLQGRRAVISSYDALSWSPHPPVPYADSS